MRRSGYIESMRSKRTILLVEDEESITTPLAEALEREGFATKVARTAAEAVEVGAGCGPTSCCST